MIQRYFNGVVPPSDQEIEKNDDISLKNHADICINTYKEKMENIEFHKGTAAIWDFISIMNKYIDTNAPWALAKDETQKAKLETVLYNLTEGLRVVSCLIFPIMPATCIKMQQALGLETKKSDAALLIDKISYRGQTKSGTKLDKPPILFPRIDTKNK